MDLIIKLKDIDPEKDKNVKVRGWIEKVTILKKHSFVILHDGVGKESHIQVYVPNNVIKISEIITESYVEITGEIRNLPGKALSFKTF